ncbi:MAG: class I SAM-dependent methyltransferase [Bacteroidales bacterium]|nr:class I SAM-dependent methyltransferase [Bacteroidales bacterium]
MESVKDKKRKANNGVKHSSFYQEQYMDGFVDKWDELIDWEGRTKGEGDFFIKELKDRKVKKVLDVATGTGYHSVRLQKAGFEVHSADGKANMLERAFFNARKQGLILRTIHSDWRSLTKDIHEKYDAVICLGNSFTHLFDENDRRKAMAEFYSVLQPEGVLILDQRNYDNMLDFGFTSKHKFYYVGDSIEAEPESIDEDLVRFKYVFNDNSVYHLNFFPLRKNYVQSILSEAGFRNIKTFADFQETYKTEDPDFFIHVAQK